MGWSDGLEVRYSSGREYEKRDVVRGVKMAESKEKLLGTEETELEHLQGEDWNEVERVILKRRSVRNYKDKQVPENVILRLIEAGRFAPSAGNCQPWKFIVVRDKELIDGMQAFAQKMAKVFAFQLHWRTSPLGEKLAKLNSQIMIRLMPNILHPVPFGAVQLIADGDLKLFHDAPTVIFIMMDRRGAAKPQVDVGICGQNIVLAAHSMGLGTCWVGFIELLKYSSKWKKFLGAQYPYQLCEAITVGYPVGDPDGMIARETHTIEWHEGGQKKTLY
jgi:nitroreductase